MIEDLIQSNRFLEWTNENGISCRLSNRGAFGWRLQLHVGGALSEQGAAQSLAHFMSETLSDEALATDISRTAERIVLHAGDGSMAELDLCSSALSFITPGGVSVVTLASAEYAQGKLMLKGILDENEAIFGGGERFDAVNKRGSAFELYTSDGWDNPHTTYIVQPLFLTTKGGGMFFNRYEQAFADFGYYDKNQWSYALRGGQLDLYVYPTGDMKTALTAFTAFTGHSQMPTPWMQGVQVCRYSPDFLHLDKDVRYHDFESIPDKERLMIRKGEKYIPMTSLSQEEQREQKYLYAYYEPRKRWMVVCLKDDDGSYRTMGPKGNPGGDSCKRIINHYIERGVKPDAALMEGYVWEDCFADTDESRAKLAELRRTVAWLHGNGIKAMVYMRIGSTNSISVGFEDSFLVHADVEVKLPEGTKVAHNTTGIPWIIGTGENPDVQLKDGSIRTATYLDITNPKAVDWYFNHIWRQMIELGIDGVKIDFCEVMPDNGRDHGISKTLYHWTNPDVFTPGTEHHAYPTFFLSAFSRRMNELKREYGYDDGFMLFSRGGGIGSQRNPYMWEGDQSRRFAKLKCQLAALINCGLSAIPFVSYDMAGYAYRWPENFFTYTAEAESEVFARAIEFTAFTTNIQTHGDVRHMYEMTPETQAIYKNYVELHYALMPYMQSCSARACETGLPPVRHLVLRDQEDAAVYGVEDEFLLGDALLVAPILDEQTFEREVYLPKGSWKNLLTGEVTEGNRTVCVKASLGKIPVFLDMQSKDAEMLFTIFESKTWQDICRG